ncbi:hypothetical protein CYMTET_43057, partial [Cymbomonas tetramitiformis]
MSSNEESNEIVEKELPVPDEQAAPTELSKASSEEYESYQGAEAEEKCDVDGAETSEFSDPTADLDTSVSVTSQQQAAATGRLRFKMLAQMSVALGIRRRSSLTPPPSEPSKPVAKPNELAELMNMGSDDTERRAALEDCLQRADKGMLLELIRECFGNLKMASPGVAASVADTFIDAQREMDGIYTDIFESSLSAMDKAAGVHAFIDKIARLSRYEARLIGMKVAFTDLTICAETDAGTVLSAVTDGVNQVRGILRTGELGFSKIGDQNNTKTLLKNITGLLPPGQLQLIAGPPQCGKSTFLKAVSGFLNPKNLDISGTITYNGVDIYEDKK